MLLQTRPPLTPPAWQESLTFLHCASLSFTNMTHGQVGLDVIMIVMLGQDPNLQISTGCTRQASSSEHQTPTPHTYTQLPEHGIKSVRDASREPSAVQSVCLSPFRSGPRPVAPCTCQPTSPAGLCLSHASPVLCHKHLRRPCERLKFGLWWESPNSHQFPHPHPLWQFWALAHSALASRIVSVHLFSISTPDVTCQNTPVTIVILFDQEMLTFPIIASVALDHVSDASSHHDPPSSTLGRA